MKVFEAIFIFPHDNHIDILFIKKSRSVSKSICVKNYLNPFQKKYLIMNFHTKLTTEHKCLKCVLELKATYWGKNNISLILKVKVI